VVICVVGAQKRSEPSLHNLPLRVLLITGSAELGKIDRNLRRLWRLVLDLPAHCDLWFVLGESASRGARRGASSDESGAGGVHLADRSTTVIHSHPPAGHPAVLSVLTQSVRFPPSIKGITGWLISSG